MGTKICYKCNRSMSLSEFGKRKDSKDGRRGVCKSCKRQHLRDYRSGGRDEELRLLRANKDRKVKLALDSLKECSLCFNTKPFKDFGVEKGGRISSQCLACNKISCKKSYRANRSTRLRQKKVYYEEKSEHLKTKRKEYYRDNHDKVLSCNTSWRKKNTAITSARGKKRYRDVKNATPTWLTDVQLLNIEILYAKCRELTQSTGIRHNVDHIFPIGHGKVSGLHVPWNLQILTASDNIKKRDDYDESQGLAY